MSQLLQDTAQSQPQPLASVNAGPLVVLLPDPQLWAQARKAYHTDDELPQREASFGRSVFFAGRNGIMAAIVWAALTAATEYRLGLVAVGLGIACGLGARRGGCNRQAQWIGASMALICCLLADYLSLIFATLTTPATQHAVSDPLFWAQSGVVFIAMQRENFSGMGLVLFAFAVWEGYRIPRSS